MTRDQAFDLITALAKVKLNAVLLVQVADAGDDEYHVTLNPEQEVNVVLLADVCRPRGMTCLHHPGKGYEFTAPVPELPGEESVPVQPCPRCGNTTARMMVGPDGQVHNCEACGYNVLYGHSFIPTGATWG